MIVLLVGSGLVIEKDPAAFGFSAPYRLFAASVNVASTRPPLPTATRGFAVAVAMPVSTWAPLPHAPFEYSDTNVWFTPATFFVYASAPLPSGAIARSPNDTMSVEGPSTIAPGTIDACAATGAASASAATRASRARRTALTLPASRGASPPGPP